MSTNTTSPGKPASSAGSTGKPPSRTAEKGKGRVEELEIVEDEDEEDEDEDEDEDEEMEEDEDEDEDDEIDPTAIVSRRTRGVKVDYTSTEALKKAGLDKEEDEEEGDNSFAHDDAAGH